MIGIPRIESKTKSRYDTYSERCGEVCTTCNHSFCEKHTGIFLTEQRFTCANHSDEEVALDQIGWNSFNCPKCGSDYSIGRKIVVREMPSNNGKPEARRAPDMVSSSNRKEILGDNLVWMTLS